MADERGIQLPRLEGKTETDKPESLNWPTLRGKSGTDLTDYYVDLLRRLGREPSLLGDIFAGAQSRFSNPVNLRRLVNLIDETEWTALDVDVKAEAFEGLLEKAASEGKKGAGQYFTPRLLIQAIVRCMKPDPRTAAAFTIMDPACGTGGFLVAAYEWLKRETGGGAFSREITGRIRRATYFGQELVARPRRLALMHLYLHGLEPEIAYCWTISEWHHLPGTLRNERREIPIPLPPLAEQRRSGASWHRSSCSWRARLPRGTDWRGCLPSSGASASASSPPPATDGSRLTGETHTPRAGQGRSCWKVFLCNEE